MHSEWSRDGCNWCMSQAITRSAPSCRTRNSISHGHADALGPATSPSGWRRKPIRTFVRNGGGGSAITNRYTSRDPSHKRTLFNDGHCSCSCWPAMQMAAYMRGKWNNYHAVAAPMRAIMLHHRYHSYSRTQLFMQHQEFSYCHRGEYLRITCLIFAGISCFMH